MGIGDEPILNDTFAVTIIGLLTLTINYTNLQLIFPRRFNKALSVFLPLLYVAVFYAILLYTGTMTTLFGGARGFIHIPMIYLLTRGGVFQRLFCITMQMLNVGVLLALSKSIAMLLAATGSTDYRLLYCIAAFIFFSFYVILTAKFGKLFVSKLYITEHAASWGIYSLGALLLFAIFAITFENVNSQPAYILIVFSTLFSMVILCYAIVNTHEKTKQAFEAEFAREVISSGREHYQRMDEMYDKLRTLRHDYKYHLVAINELLDSGDKETLSRYMEGINDRYVESEIQSFCGNTVINALLANYAARCSETSIIFTADISLPEALSVPDYDLCIILGNLLQNAVEACQKQDGGREAEIILRPLGGQLAIRVKNSFDGQVCTNDGRIKTMKADGGFGLRSVEAVAARYDGELLVNWEGNTFSAYVTLRL